MNLNDILSLLGNLSPKINQDQNRNDSNINQATTQNSNNTQNLFPPAFPTPFEQKITVSNSSNFNNPSNPFTQEQNSNSQNSNQPILQNLLNGGEIGNIIQNFLPLLDKLKGSGILNNLLDGLNKDKKNTTKSGEIFSTNENDNDDDFNSYIKIDDD